MKKKQLTIAWVVLINLGLIVSVSFAQDIQTESITIPREEVLTDEKVKVFYEDFKNTIFYPPNPDTIEKIEDFKIRNIKEIRENIIKLYLIISFFRMSLRQEVIEEKYAGLLNSMAMRLYTDITYLDLLRNGKLNRFSMEVWYGLGNKQLEKAKEEYKKLFGGENEK